MVEDDNKEILKLIADRMEMGKAKYGHGVRVDDDVSEFSQTKDDSWLQMQLEEVLDGLVYGAACILRLKRITADKL